MSNYTRLELGRRCSIATFLSMGAQLKIIAERTGRHRSTIYREIKRNELVDRYLPGKDN
jgi:IS30 family transposase